MVTESKHNSLLDKAKAWAPVLQQQAAALEEQRHLSPSLAAELAKQGMFRLLTPKRYGGYEVSVSTFSEILSELSKGDPSVAWCSMIANTSALAAAYLDETAAREIFVDPNVITAGIFAPMGRAEIKDGYYEVSGRWQWCSGGDNAQWFSGGCVLIDKGKPSLNSASTPRTKMFLLPRTDVELVDTWQVVGLKGTGSGDMQVRNARVPLNRCFSIVEDKPVINSPLYLFPVFGLLAVGIASVALGNAQGAMDDYRSDLIGRKEKTSRQTSSSQIELAKVTALLRSAQSYLKDAIEKNWQAAEQKGEIDIQDKADLRLSCVNATRISAEVCRVIYDMGGGSSVFLSSFIQKRVRDANVMTQHIMVGRDIYELSGRVLAGDQSPHPLL